MGLFNSVGSWTLDYNPKDFISNNLPRFINVFAFTEY